MISEGKIFFLSFAFKFQTVKGMLLLWLLYENKLYYNFKFYRVSKIKQFITSERFIKIILKITYEFKIYSDFILDWIQYRNPLWYKVALVNKIR